MHNCMYSKEFALPRSHLILNFQSLIRDVGMDIDIIYNINVIIISICNDCKGEYLWNCDMWAGTLPVLEKG